MQTDTITLRELTIRYAPKTDADGQPFVVGRKLTTPAECGSILLQLLQGQPCEVFAILCLSTKHRVIAYHEVSRGTLDATLVHPREVCKAALLANAAAIVLCHNHPSGEPMPSPDDSITSSSATDAITVSRTAVVCRAAHRRPATQLKVLEQSIEVRLLPICCRRAIREAPKPHESLVC